MVNGWSASPTVCRSLSTVAIAMPKRSGSIAASSGETVRCDGGLAAVAPLDYDFGPNDRASTTMDICEVRPKGRIDSATGPAFEKDVLRQIDDGHRRLLLDFADLQYISSAGLRIVLLAAKRMKAAGGRLALCSLNPQIAEVFEISGFSRILDIHPSRDAALATLSAA